MFRAALQRLGTTVLMVLSLLFSQVALAYYTCPTATTTDQVVMEMAPGEPCEGMGADADQPVLCHQHCSDAPQSFAIKLPTLGLPAVMLVLQVPRSLDTAAQAARAFAEAGQPQPPPEPVFLSTLRLRV